MTLLDWIQNRPDRVTHLARELAIKGVPTLIYQWASGARPIPLERCVPIEKATLGEVRCEELRPDKAGDFAYLRGNSHQVPA